MSQIIDGKLERNETNENSMSGSELMALGLIEHMGEEALEPFQIVLSRLRAPLRDDKIKIYWAHDLAEDPEAERALGNSAWRQFHKIIFVSVTQCQSYIARFGIPWSRTVVLKNAIKPIKFDPKSRYNPEEENPVINFVYHTTPHRGLALLVPVFEKLIEEGNEDIHLDVYSSFKLYGWDERDKSYEPLYDRIRDNDKMTYHGAVSNDVVREALSLADVFAYPSVWQETSCIALIEAMSAGLVCVHPNTGALYETAANWTYQYHFNEDMSAHASHMYTMLVNLLPLIREQNEGLKMKVNGMTNAANINYSWDIRKVEWEGFLNSLRNIPTKLEEVGEDEEMFHYKIG